MPGSSTNGSPRSSARRVPPNSTMLPIGTIGTAPSSRQAASIENDPGRPRSSHSQVRGEPSIWPVSSTIRRWSSLGVATPASWRENSSSAAATSALSCSERRRTVFCSATDAR